MTQALAVLLFLAVTAYGVLGGADFGAGFWDLFAGSAEKGRATRDHIAHALGPVWEANHVWLIFALVVLWTGFPRAFGPIMSTLFVPLTIAAVGIILRGTGFAFRKAVTTLELQRVFGAAFAASSILTPFCLGAVVGGVASGRVPVTGTGDLVTSWLNPSGALGGMLAVVVCAYLAATFLAADAQRGGEPQMAAAFRARALGAGLAAGAVAVVGIAVLHADAPDLFHGLTHRGLALVLGSGVAGVAALMMLRASRFGVARALSATAVVTVLWGWAAGQYPFLLERRMTLEQAAGARTTQTAMVGVVVVGMVLLAPSLAWLFLLVERGQLGTAGPASTPSAAGPTAAGSAAKSRRGDEET